MGEVKVQEPQVVNLTDDFSERECVSFDPEALALEGNYNDELSAHRAKRSWTNVLETTFLLDKGHDFKLRVVNPEANYLLRCEFTTACGRYAFWRLTNNQAPEAQYQIETAHIPNAEAHALNLLHAADMQRASESDQDPVSSSARSIVSKMRSLFGRLK